MKQQLTYLFVALTVLFASCAKEDVLFTYSPSQPHAGESITFSNQTSEGEEWAWNFGDGSTSTSKSPSKVYKKPGTYTVTLKVDDKASRTYSVTLTVVDTIPTISCSDTLIRYYEPVTLTAQCYNPYSYDLSYEWTLSEGMELYDGDLDDRSITVFFTKTETEVPVHCQLTQGKTIWSLDTAFYINDTKASSLVLAEPGKLFHQRIYKYGFEEIIPYNGIPASYLTSPSALYMNDDMLYIFNDDQTADGALVRYNINTTSAENLIKNAAAGANQGFSYGCVKGNNIYWTADDRICKASASTLNQSYDASASAMLLTTADALGYGLTAGQKAAGLSYCNGIFYYAYGQGLHRFAESEIGGTPEEGSILTDQTITAFAIDAIAQKIYFTTADGLHVSTLAGTNVVLVDANANGKSIAIDNAANQLFWTTNSGVFHMPLIQTINNVSAAEPAQLNDRTTITALTIDKTQR